MAIIKRQRESEEGGKESIDLANSLMLLSNAIAIETTNKLMKKPYYAPVEFECKTCSRKFSSFQALGGHRASHKRPKLEGGLGLIKSEAQNLSLLNNNKPKIHECSICGMEFPLGQALGGHMRKHRALATDEGGFPASSISQQGVVGKSTPVMKRSNSSKRVMCIMDLNLTPLENDLKLLFGNKAPQVDLSLF